ncbi:hypothetical protein MKX03_032678 [Papaver bracteatum]|nr:hypothetical protein MKX03_032678 [Papaver bracteatum]
MVRGRPRKFNQNPVLDFRSITDNAWYTVDRLVFCKKNNTLTIRFMGFDNRDDDEELSVEDFKTLKELDEFVDRFRSACVQLQDGECYDMRRGSYVCAVFDPSEENHKFYDGVIESIEREPHRREGGEACCSCIYVVGWLEGPNARCTEQMGIKRIYKLQPGSPLFDQALACFVKMARAQLT